MLSRVEHRHQRLDFWPVAAGNVGNLLEWYDFVVFAFLAPVVIHADLLAKGELSSQVRRRECRR